MVEMDRVRKWPREHLEKRFHELDVHIGELEKMVNDLEEMKSNVEDERDAAMVDIRRVYDLLAEEKRKSFELTSTVLVLNQLLTEARKESHI